ncbi:MAG: Crp/Fnr family transcriptional regulator [Chitinophagales bacterium]
MTALPAPLRQSFEPALQQAILQSAQEMRLPEGQVLVEIGQIVKQMPLLTSGTIKVSRVDQEGNELLLYYVNANESCAMTFACCMQQYPSEIKATAETDITLLMIPISFMDEWMARFPSWKNFVMNTIRNRFNELLNAIDQLAFQKLDERLVHYLKEKAKATGSTLIRLSHEQIANDMASSREVISRLLKKLENDKKVLLYRHEIKLLKDL